MKQFFRTIFREILPKLFLWQSPDSMDKSKKTDKRIGALKAIVCVVVSFLVLYFAYLMLLRGGEYSRQAYEQQTRTFTTKATRGNIYDCNGKPLAVTVETCTISVSRDEVRRYGKEDYEDGDQTDYQRLVSRKLAEFLGMEPAAVLERMQMESNYWNVATDVSVEVGTKIREWINEEKIKGVSVEADTSRYYPYGSLGAHLIGFTGTDDHGLVGGIEVALDRELAGTDGKVVATVEKNGNAIPGETREVIEILRNGANAWLTMDVEIQKIAEATLAEAIRDFGVVEGGAVIVMDPKTADVKAMASYPTFDLNNPRFVSPDVERKFFWQPQDEEASFLSDIIWRNKAINTTYEPGSTFKAITASVAVEEDLVGLDEEISDDPLDLAGWTIHCSTSLTPGGHGQEKFRMAVANSCNPVMARVALRAGVDTYFKYVRAFGFMNKTNILLSGETVGMIFQNPTEIDLAVTAFGQRFTITPIQIATAYCAIANGGTLYEPRLVKQLTDESGGVVKAYPQNEVRQVISENTSKTVMGLLEGVVRDGTGERAYVTGYRVAGKTGTSQTTTTETTGRYVVSFSAVAPSDNPELIVLVVLDHPTIGDISGAKMGAWTAATIVKKVLTYMGVEKVYTEDDAAKIRNVYYLNDFSGISLNDAMNDIKTSTRLYNVILLGDVTDDAVVVRQVPEPNVYICREGTVVLYLSDDPELTPGTAKVPNVVGMPLCEAHAALTGAGINMDTRSGDVIVEQSIEPGTDVELGTVVECRSMTWEEYEEYQKNEVLEDHTES